MMLDSSEKWFECDGAQGVGCVSMPSLSRIYRVVGEYFPEIIEETVICLSVAATLLLEDQQNPVAVNRARGRVRLGRLVLRLGPRHRETRAG